MKIALNTGGPSNNHHQSVTMQSTAPSAASSVKNEGPATKKGAATKSTKKQNGPNSISKKKSEAQK